MTSVEQVTEAHGSPAADGDTAAVDELLSERTLRVLDKRRQQARPQRRRWLVRRALAIADVVGLSTAFALAEAAAAIAAAGAVDRVDLNSEIAAFALALPAWVLLFRLYGLYASDEARADHSTVDDFFGVFNVVSVGTWTFFAGCQLTGLAHPSVAKLTVFWAAAAMFVPLGRALARTACRRSDAYVQNTLIVGAGHVGQKVARKLMQHPEYGVNVVGFIDEHPRTRPSDLGHLPVLGSADDVRAWIRRLDVERVIVGFSRAPHRDTLDIIRELNHLDVQVDVVPRLFEVMGPHVRLHTAEGMTLLGLPPARLSRTALRMKRAVDVTFATLGVLVLAPLLVTVAVAISVDTRGPVLFRQVRMGRDDRTFRIFKFRTMVVDAEERKQQVAHLSKHAEGDARMFKVADDPRVTRVGRLLRRTSIDELPQLFNVIRGEMSLVGPRPLILDEDQFVAGWARRRLELTPGITGLWQVLGRDDIPFGEMVELDYLYVTGWSLVGDLKLIFRTIAVLGRGRAG